jgi:oxygen-independent coproporphyrinogen-3 oxidase
MEKIQSLYLHIPFCTWVCKYCDFNTYAVLEGLIPAYTDALRKEIEVVARRYPVGPLDTVFFGGGTPSLLSQAQLETIVRTVSDAIGLRSDAEVTLEANPGNISAASCLGWLAAGVNRLSIGVQSLRPAALRFLERLHSGEEAVNAIRAARVSGFSNINCDLLYGLPGVSTAAFLEDLSAVLAERPQHLSAYELTVEPVTRLAQEVRAGQVVMPEADLQLEQYWAAAEVLAAEGFDHYEISNWAQPGYRCRHNLTYWEYRPYLGCGAGAHSLLRHDDGSSERFWNVKGPHAYIDAVAAQGVAVAGREVLETGRAGGEAAMIGMRLLDGTRAAGAFPAERQRLAAAGLLVEEGETVRLTRRGVELANQVGAAFLR